MTGHPRQVQLESFHVWHARRGTTRIRSILLGEIYKKALKRPDYSGSINSFRLQRAQKKLARTLDPMAQAEVEEYKTKKSKKGGGKDGSADVGKVVQLMSSKPLRRHDEMV